MFVSCSSLTMDFPAQTEMVDMKLGEKLNGTLGAESTDARYRDGRLAGRYRIGGLLINSQLAAHFLCR